MPVGIGFNTSFSDLTGGLKDIFGEEGYKAVVQDEERDLKTDITGTTKEELDKTTGTKGTRTEYLDIDPEGVERLKNQILGGVQGLASVFSGEQTAGLYNTTVAAQASGDLVAQLAGEIAKLTAKKVSEVDETTTEAGDIVTDIDKTERQTGTISTDIETISGSEGLVDPLVDLAGAIGEEALDLGEAVGDNLVDLVGNPITTPTAPGITTPAPPVASLPPGPSSTILPTSTVDPTTSTVLPTVPDYGIGGSSGQSGSGAGGGYGTSSDVIGLPPTLPILPSAKDLTKPPPVIIPPSTNIPKNAYTDAYIAWAQGGGKGPEPKKEDFENNVISGTVTPVIVGGGEGVYTPPTPELVFKKFFR